MSQFCVIFGGSGYIGSRWAARLVSRNPKTRVLLCDLLLPSGALPDRVQFATCDVRQPIRAQLAEADPDWIFNFAAIHREPGHAAQEYFDTNVAGARQVCAFAEQTGCSNLFFTSSISVYGPTSGPTPESSPLYPRTPYGVSKLCAELIHEAWLKAGPGRRLVVCRPGVVYGPGDPGNILRMIRAVQRGYFFFPGSTRIRKSYAYIEGLLDSFEFTLGRPEPHMVFNYVEKETETVGELVRIIRRYLNCRAPVLSAPPQLLVVAAALIQTLSRGRSTLHPARVRKAATPTHIVPERLKNWGFEFQYDFSSSLSHWAQASHDFKLSHIPRFGRDAFHRVPLVPR
jgi:nucleoside-diphosphate-sugar epimerase